MQNSVMVFPVLALIGWTFVMWVWLYVTRIPAMRRAEVDLVELSNSGGPLDLPPKVTRVADNYNHLHEQPTLFYALALGIAVLGVADTGQLALAWTYVGLRVVHSLIQATGNVIMARFSVFAVASGVLFALFVRTVWLAVAA